MKHLTVAQRCVCLALSLMGGSLAAGAQAPLERLFCYVDREDSYQSLVKHIDQITVLAPQVYVVDSLGIPWGSLDKRVLDLAKAHNVKVMPLFTNEARCCSTADCTTECASSAHPRLRDGIDWESRK